MAESAVMTEILGVNCGRPAGFRVTCDGAGVVLASTFVDQIDGLLNDAGAFGRRLGVLEIVLLRSPSLVSRFRRYLTGGLSAGGGPTGGAPD